MDGKCRGMPGGRPLKKIFEAYGAGTHYWTPPAGKSQVIVALSGGGGGGGGGSNGASCYGGDGGAGSYMETLVRLNPAQALKIVLGSGGSGGSVGATDNAARGGDSYIQYMGSDGYVVYVPGGVPGRGNGAAPINQLAGTLQGGRGGYGAYWSGGLGYEHGDGYPATLGGGLGGTNATASSGGVPLGGGGGGGIGQGGISGAVDLSTNPTAGGYGAGGGGGQGNTGGGAKAGAAGGDGGIIIYELPSP